MKGKLFAISATLIIVCSLCFSVLKKPFETFAVERDVISSEGDNQN